RRCRRCPHSSRRCRCLLRSFPGACRYHRNRERGRGRGSMSRADVSFEGLLVRERGRWSFKHSWRETGKTFDEIVSRGVPFQDSEVGGVPPAAKPRNHERPPGHTVCVRPTAMRTWLLVGVLGIGAWSVSCTSSSGSSSGTDGPPQTDSANVSGGSPGAGSGGSGGTGG